MAERYAAPTGQGRRCAALTWPVRAYGLLAWTWMRAAAQYPLSMVMLSLATAAVTALDVAGVALLFAHTPRIAGFTAPEVLFLYGGWPNIHQSGTSPNSRHGNASSGAVADVDAAGRGPSDQFAAEGIQMLIRRHTCGCYGSARLVAGLGPGVRHHPVGVRQPWRPEAEDGMGWRARSGPYQGHRWSTTHPHCKTTLTADARAVIEVVLEALAIPHAATVGHEATRDEIVKTGCGTRWCAYNAPRRSLPLALGPAVVGEHCRRWERVFRKLDPCSAALRRQGRQSGVLMGSRPVLPIPERCPAGSLPRVIIVRETDDLVGARSRLEAGRRCVS